MNIKFLIFFTIIGMPLAFAQEQNVSVNGFSVMYSAQNTEISKITTDQNLVALHIDIIPKQDDILSITIPRDLIDAKISGSDDDFYLLVDGIESIYEETTTAETRTLSIPVTSQNTKITIIGTQLQKLQTESAKPQEKSGCLIATATYGTELAPQVQLLREVRDNVLFGTDSGTVFMVQFNEFYYFFSPTVSDLERASPQFRELVKITLTPMLSILSILNHVDIDSESEMLGYGMGIILLNTAMYFIAPVIIIVTLRQKFRKI